MQGPAGHRKDLAEKAWNWASVFTGFPWLLQGDWNSLRAVGVERSGGMPVYHAKRANRIYRGVTGPAEISLLNEGRMERPQLEEEGYRQSR